MSTEDYVQAIKQWQMEMDTNLRRENNWLALAGLFWLKRGFTTFGSSPDCDIVLPRRVAKLMGAFEFDGTNVNLRLDVGHRVDLNGQPVENTVALKNDHEASHSYITFEDLRMVILRRADKFAVRLWDNQRPQRAETPARAWFPIDDKYRLMCLYTPYPVPVKVQLLNAFGETEEDEMGGYVSFNLGGKNHELDVTDLDDGRLYIQFKDLTNGAKTYPNGRYLYSETVAEDGLVLVDFNKAYSPPCGFTEYATCTFAPKQNQLHIAIEAGEIYGK